MLRGGFFVTKSFPCRLTFATISSQVINLICDNLLLALLVAPHQWFVSPLVGLFVAKLLLYCLNLVTQLPKDGTVLFGQTRYCQIPHYQTPTGGTLMLVGVLLCPVASSSNPALFQLS